MIQMLLYQNVLTDVNGFLAERMLNIGTFFFFLKPKCFLGGVQFMD